VHATIVNTQWPHFLSEFNGVVIEFDSSFLDEREDNRRCTLKRHRGFSCFTVHGLRRNTSKNPFCQISSRPFSASVRMFSTQWQGAILYQFELGHDVNPYTA
jgi:hypothetical protein